MKTQVLSTRTRKRHLTSPKNGRCSYGASPCETSVPKATRKRDRPGVFDNSDVNKDINCMFPIDRIHELAKEGFIKACAPVHAGFMGGGGNQEKFKGETGPAIAQMFKEEEVDAVVLTAG